MRISKIKLSTDKIGGSHPIKENQWNQGKTRLSAGCLQGYPSQGYWSLSPPEQKTVANYV